MKTLYFDCFAGASGNMILGALIALGVDERELESQLGLLPVSGFTIEKSIVDRSGISATHVNVFAQEETEHRHLNNIEKIIDDSGLTDRIKERSKLIFARLAAAEAEVHGIDIQKVHFHEVGAVDAIVDIVGCCIGFDLLGVERFACSKIHVGSGFVKMAHGTYPVPPPAVSNLLAGIPAYSTDVAGELLTPTGAAIIATLCTTFGPLPEMTVERSGYGAGTRAYENFPNALRLIVGITEGKATSFQRDWNAESSGLISERLVLIETNLDDLSGQVVGFVSERALSLGALDCWVTPIQMKKNRPATLLSVLCTEEMREPMTELLLTETTTLGVRIIEVDRRSLPRETRTVETRYGPIDVKTATYRGRPVNVMPEYEDVRRAAIEHSVPFREVQAEAVRSFESKAAAAKS